MARVSVHVKTANTRDRHFGSAVIFSTYFRLEIFRGGCGFGRRLWSNEALYKANYQPIRQSTGMDNSSAFNNKARQSTWHAVGVQTGVCFASVVVLRSSTSIIGRPAQVTRMLRSMADWPRSV